MSDFDKEAERRRLREKYDEDEPRRQETARMSELLLKGATMTNRHCDDCGAPIFRYDGQEFCPNCQGGGAADAESADAASETETTAEADASAPETGASAAEAAAPESDQPADGGAAAPSRNGSDVDRDAVTSTRTGDSDSSADAAERSPASPPTSSASASSASPATGESSTTTATDARDALLRAVTTHATRGEAADDPRRARDHLAAAREAAEALSALDR